VTALRWDAVTVDCRDAESLAAFWAALLGVEVRGRWQQYVGLHPVTPGQPRLVFQQQVFQQQVFQQQVGDPRPQKPSLHLDLHVPAVADLPGAVERAVGLGARLVDTVEQDGQSWRVLADPEGNLFCLVAEPAPAE
jgi:catechol 2,3-dioxygenase-like lactoylglutathione lyase family enzyme